MRRSEQPADWNRALNYTARQDQVLRWLDDLAPHRTSLDYDPGHHGDEIACLLHEEGIRIDEPDADVQAFIREHATCDERPDPPDYPDDDDDYLIDGVGFADPGGRSALRAATKNNPRNLPCPTCGEPNRLTPADRARGYQCDACADRAERGDDGY